MKVSQRKRRLKVIFMLFLFFLFSCHRKEDQRQVGKEVPCLTEAEKNEMQIIEVADTRVVQKLRLNGKVSYDPNAVIHYVSPMKGTIISTCFSLGDKVKKGQVMAEIKSTELNSLSAKAEQLRTKLKVAERELSAIQSFYKDEVASERELIAAKGEKRTLEAELKNLQTNLALYSARSDDGTFQIKAPRSGFVVENRLVSGMRFRAESEPLFTISDLDKVWINLNIYATDINFVTEGMTVNIKSGSFPDKVFRGEIDHIAPVIAAEENVLKARVVLENTEMLLKPGLYVEAIVETKKSDRAIRLPTAAVVFYNNRYYALVLEGCTTVVRPIEILYQDENYAYIQNGLLPGERVVTANTLLQFENAVAAEQHE